MFDVNGAATEEQRLAAFCDALAPASIPLGVIAQVYESLARMERLVAGAKLRLAARVEKSNHWRTTGHRTATDWLAHIAGSTAGYWSGCDGWWRPRFTPAHASWLNQAEPLIGAFAYHYLKRGSWASRQDFIEHVRASGPEYNQRYARPFNWTWTNDQMRKWFAKHAQRVCCRTS